MQSSKTAQPVQKKILICMNVWKVFFHWPVFTKKHFPPKTNFHKKIITKKTFSQHTCFNKKCHQLTFFHKRPVYKKWRIERKRIYVILIVPQDLIQELTFILSDKRAQEEIYTYQVKYIYSNNV